MFREDRKYKPFTFDPFEGVFKGGGGKGGGGGGDRKKQKQNVDALEKAIRKLIATMRDEQFIVDRLETEYTRLQKTIANLLVKKKTIQQ